MFDKNRWNVHCVFMVNHFKCLAHLFLPLPSLADHKCLWRALPVEFVHGVVVYAFVFSGVC